VTLGGGEAVAAVLGRYNAGGATQRTMGLVRLQVGRLAVLVPAAEQARAVALVRAADDLGLISTCALARVFPGNACATRSVHLRTALGWLGAHIVAS
jgi:hypothetical protein